jgi:transcriptional regulator with XRE-family HTH domain
MREIRERLGISQADIARLMSERGWSYYPQTVQRIEAGRRRVSIGEADAIARILQTTIEKLTSSVRTQALDDRLRVAEMRFRQAKAHADEAAHIAAASACQVAELESELVDLKAAAQAAKAAADRSPEASASVMTIRPRSSSWDERDGFVNALLARGIVVLDLADTPKPDFVRWVDYMSGVVSGCGGFLEHIGPPERRKWRLLATAPPPARVGSTQSADAVGISPVPENNS